MISWSKDHKCTQFTTCNTTGPGTYNSLPIPDRVTMSEDFRLSFTKCSACTSNVTLLLFMLNLHMTQVITIHEVILFLFGLIAFL